ncbi:RagB/SusD family nutrient uptake outer membrane protein [Parapedobacter tibetensis]|uniref:RagB/SusD family nutrient uptake outer membrane protein n=1 Tax=Parapedobacter tibetensis TaxID=2972951 RepID=UPI00214D4812|nr:RagB/SusD family nutrient uptake outer membrane protein [Parapedobacter tibetensis]
MKQKNENRSIRSYHLCFLIITSVSLYACESYLDKKSSDNIAIPSSLKDVRAILDNSLMLNFRSPSMGEASADDYFLPMDRYNALARESYREAYVWSLGIYNFDNDWATSYYTVYIANVALDALNGIPKTGENSAEWNTLSGSALTYRANALMRAAWIFCKAYDQESAATDFGLPLRTTSDINVSFPRASVGETYQLILDDLGEACRLLPETSQLPTRPTKAGAYGLLARVHLSMRQYDHAFNYADSCLQRGDALMDYNTEINPAALQPFTAFNKEVIFSTLMFYTFANVYPTYGRIDSVLYASYDDSDIRKTAFFRSMRNGMEFKGAYSTGRTSYFTGISTAEMLLIRAECAARKRDIELALGDLNTLLANRISANEFSVLDIDGEANVLKKVLEERRKELVMRDLRWIDLKRLNKEGADIIPLRLVDGVAYSIEPNSNRYALPLPNDVVMNSNLEQNPF